VFLHAMSNTNKYEDVFIMGNPCRCSFTDVTLRNNYSLNSAYDVVGYILCLSLTFSHYRI